MCTNRGVLTLLVATLFLGHLATASWASDLLSRAIPDPGTVRGVVVVAGLEETSTVARSLAKTPVVLLVVASDRDEQDRLQSVFAKSGILGQTSVVVLDAQGRIPLADHSAAVAVADLDVLPKLTEQELTRIVRPFGTLHVGKDGKWNEQLQPRPEGMDDWTHYHRDAANSEHSTDTLVGPARGLQWIAGPTNKQNANWVMHETLLTTHVPRGVDFRLAGLMARDAFSGLPLWFRNDIRPLTRFAVVLDEEHIYFHAIERHWAAPHTVALDRRTGKTVKTYDEGLDFTVTEEDVKKDRRAPQYALKRAEDLQLRLIGGLLIQVIREQVVVLDAATGERKWSRKASDGRSFVHPTAGDDTLYVVEGEYVRHSSYTHWPMSKPDRIHALQLKDGKTRWTCDWDEKKYGRAHAIYNLQLEGNLLCGAGNRSRLGEE